MNEKGYDRMEKIENLYDTVLIDPNEDLVLLDKTKSSFGSIKTVS